MRLRLRHWCMHCCGYMRLASCTPEVSVTVMMHEPFEGRAVLRRLALTHICSMQASRARRAWREAQGAVSISLAECDVKVDDARLERPSISLTRLNTDASPSRTLVSEMMIMAGQIATEYGETSSAYIVPHSLRNLAGRGYSPACAVPISCSLCRVCATQTFFP